MDLFERQIIASIYTIRKNGKRPYIESIFIISSNSANNITKRHVEEKINLLLSDKKNRKPTNKTRFR